MNDGREPKAIISAWHVGGMAEWDAVSKARTLDLSRAGMVPSSRNVSITSQRMYMNSSASALCMRILSSILARAPIIPFHLLCLLTASRVARDCLVYGSKLLTDYHDL